MSGFLLVMILTMVPASLESGLDFVFTARPLNTGVTRGLAVFRTAVN